MTLSNKERNELAFDLVAEGRQALTKRLIAASRTARADHDKAGLALAQKKLAVLEEILL